MPVVWSLSTVLGHERLFRTSLLRMSLRTELSPMIVQRSQVQKTFEQLVKNARAKGLEPDVNHWTELFNVGCQLFL